MDSFIVGRDGKRIATFQVDPTSHHQVVTVAGPPDSAVEFPLEHLMTMRIGAVYDPMDDLYYIVIG
jgi:hypothetical protein